MNSRQIFSGKLGLNVSPNCFLKPWLLVNENTNRFDVPETFDFHENVQYITEMNRNLEVLSRLVGNSHSLFISLLKQLFITDKMKHFQKSKKYDFLKGDIVLVLRTQDYNLAKIIEAGPYYCTVLSAQSNKPTEKKIHNQKMILIFRPRSEGANQNQRTSERTNHNQGTSNLKNMMSIVSPTCIPVTRKHKVSDEFLGRKSSYTPCYHIVKSGRIVVHKTKYN